MESSFDIELCPIQLKDWSIEKYISNVCEIDENESFGKVTLSTDVSLPKEIDNNEYVLGLKVHIKEESEKYVITHDCEIRGVYALSPNEDIDNNDILDLVQRIGIQELYSIMKTYVFIMSSSTSRPPVVLPSLNIKQS